MGLLIRMTGGGVWDPLFPSDSLGIVRTWLFSQGAHGDLPICNSGNFSRADCKPLKTNWMETLTSHWQLRNWTAIVFIKPWGIISYYCMYSWTWSQTWLCVLYVLCEIVNRADLKLTVRKSTINDLMVEIFYSGYSKSILVVDDK